MSTRTQDVLLSDDRIAERVDEYVLPYRTEITRVTKEFRDIYEAERTKLLDLIRQGVEAAKVVASRRGPFHADIETHRFLSKVKEQLPNL